MNLTKREQYLKKQNLLFQSKEKREELWKKHAPNSRRIARNKSKNLRIRRFILFKTTLLSAFEKISIKQIVYINPIISLSIRKKLGFIFLEKKYAVLVFILFHIKKNHQRNQID